MGAFMEDVRYRSAICLIYRSSCCDRIRLDLVYFTCLNNHALNSSLTGDTSQKIKPGAGDSGAR